MSEALYQHYEGELHFIRRMAQDFAQRYPAAAGRLRLETNRSADPHVERLIEAFALLSARVQLKIHDEFPELTDALFGVLYPHYLAPVPSCSLVQFEADPLQPLPPTGHTIKVGSPLFTPPVGGVRLQYRTAYPVTLWPLVLQEASLEPPPFPAGIKPPERAASVLRLRFELTGETPWDQLQLDKLRLHLHGDGGLAYPLYELLLNHAIQVVFRPVGGGGKPVVKSAADCLSPVGFNRDDGLLSYPPQSFPGYRLLTEYFAFPAKYLFVDLGGWPAVKKAGLGKRVEVLIFCNRSIPRLEQSVDATNFRAGCTPAVNLFELTAEPISLTHQKPDYLVLPDAARRAGTEVYAIERVTGALPDGQNLEFRPFYSYRHGEKEEEGGVYWVASRRPSIRPDDKGTDVSVAIVDRRFNPLKAPDTVLVVRTLCTNRDLPAKLPRDGAELRFDIPFAAPVSRVRCLGAPTPSLRPPLRRGAYWRLLSHLNLNYLSLSHGQDGLDALKELLRLYDYSDPNVDGNQLAVVRQHIEGMTRLTSKSVVGCIGPPGRGGYCRGTEVGLEFDDAKYTGGSAFLFASVLERFLGLYTTVNSFTQLVATTKQGEIRRWPPRAGDQPLL